MVDFFGATMYNYERCDSQTFGSTIVEVIAMIDRFKYVIRSIAAGFWFSFALGWNFAVFTSSLRNYRFPIIMMIVIIGGVLPPYLIYNRKLLMGLVGLALSLVAFYFSESYLSPLCDYGRFDYRDYSEADGKGIFIVLGMPFLLLIGLQILVLLTGLIIDLARVHSERVMPLPDDIITDYQKKQFYVAIIAISIFAVTTLLMAITNPALF